MERVSWTDERLDELAARMDAGFARVDQELRDLRGMTMRVGGGIIVALIGLTAAVFANGA